MSFVRRLENRVYGSVRHPAAAEVTARDATEWRPADLNGHKYCLLTSYRASGAPVTIPVWFGYGLGRRIYRLLGRGTRAVYLEVSGPPAGPP